MDYEFLTIEVDDGLGVVTMNRPPGNALADEFLHELEPMVEQVSTDEEIRCVLFESALEKAFMVGADLKALPDGADLSQMDPTWTPKQSMSFILSKVGGQIAGMLEQAQRVMNGIESLPKPSIAVIGGHALGGGLEFALACDFRLMARGKPKIGLSEVGLGLIPAAGGCQRLPRVVGHARALEMISLARRMDADEAERIGLITRAVDPELLAEEARTLGRTLAGAATVAIGCAKKAILTGEMEGLDAGLAAERDGIQQLTKTLDLAEGLLAFNMKTQPQFEGR
ncbi:MAG: enoyl-CoA hydratase/isomerase family protein [Actinobacteria bacterium]|nr:enoyl-CoA hydratase/isomerase family protein [Actinomycetota bacterium]MBU1944202.1 enoyl-CoA hydratase/isomerase family protein [Actinomycetota bacterium]MBU2688405.1 enoyl-CoA hydratase/isomerase family protein [Actinomycetota bacterium]